MTNPHERARQLMLDETISGIGSEDSAWLTRHLLDCQECCTAREQLAGSIHVFRAASVNAPPFLAARTRADIHARVSQLAQKAERRNVIWLAALFDAGWTAMAIIFLVNAAGWFGVAVSSQWMWLVAVTWFWLLPGMAGLLLIFVKKNGHLPNTPAWHWLGAEGDYRG